MSDLIPSAIIAGGVLLLTLAVHLRNLQLARRRKQRAQRRRILRYLHTHHNNELAPDNVVSLDTYSRKVQP